MTLRQLWLAIRAAMTPAPQPLPTFETLSYGPASLDVRRPTGAVATDERRVIVMVHGGGFVDGDKANDNVWVNKKAHYVDSLGDVLVCINYRLDVAPNVQAQDVAAAVSFVRKMPGIDPDNIVLMAHSAGGTDAALALGLCVVAKVVLLDPASLDAVATMDHPHDAVFNPLGDTREEWEANSPIAQLSGPIPPCFIAVSNARGKAFMQQAQAFANQALHLGCLSAAVLAFPDLDHEQCNANVGLPGDLTDAIDKFLA